MDGQGLKAHRMHLRLVGLTLAVMAVQAGCQSGEQRTLNASADALKAEDYDQATMLANEALDDSTRPEVAAEALYIRGRSYEQRPVVSRAQLDANLQAARTSYLEALKHNPPRKLQTYIRASLGKVALYQDDFAVAIQQLSAAYPGLEESDLKAATLYHLGKAQQRSGQFQQADKTFASVMEGFRGTNWAKKAGETRGARGFYIQLAVYKNPQSAEKVTQALRQRGCPPVLLRDSQQRYLMRTGPFASFAQAKQVRARLTDISPDATILP